MASTLHFAMWFCRFLHIYLINKAKAIEYWRDVALGNRCFGETFPWKHLVLPLNISGKVNLVPGYASFVKRRKWENAFFFFLIIEKIMYLRVNWRGGQLQSSAEKTWMIICWRHYMLSAFWRICDLANVMPLRNHNHGNPHVSFNNDYFIYNKT